MDVDGVKGQSRTASPPRRPVLPPHRNPNYCKMSLGDPVRGQRSGILYQGCSEHILFFKRTTFVEFSVYWQASENVFNFIMFTNVLFTSYLLE